MLPGTCQMRKEILYKNIRYLFREQCGLSDSQMICFIILRFPMFLALDCYFVDFILISLIVVLGD